jgi:hypothetical protein
MTAPDIVAIGEPLREFNPTTTGFGAVAPLPRADEVRKLLGA